MCCLSLRWIISKSCMYMQQRQCSQTRRLAEENPFDVYSALIDPPILSNSPAPRPREMRFVSSASILCLSAFIPSSGWAHVTLHDAVLDGNIAIVKATLLRYIRKCPAKINEHDVSSAKPLLRSDCGSLLSCARFESHNTFCGASTKASWRGSKHFFPSIRALGPVAERFRRFCPSRFQTVWPGERHKLWLGLIHTAMECKTYASWKATNEKISKK